MHLPPTPHHLWSHRRPHLQAPTAPRISRGASEDVGGAVFRHIPIIITFSDCGDTIQTTRSTRLGPVGWVIQKFGCRRRPICCRLTIGIMLLGRRCLVLGLGFLEKGGDRILPIIACAGLDQINDIPGTMVLYVEPRVCHRGTEECRRM
jgi:hypothetical protein